MPFTKRTEYASAWTGKGLNPNLVQQYGMVLKNADVKIGRLLPSKAGPSVTAQETKADGGIPLLLEDDSPPRHQEFAAGRMRS